MSNAFSKPLLIYMYMYLVFFGCVLASPTFNFFVSVFFGVLYKHRKFHVYARILPCVH